MKTVAGPFCLSPPPQPPVWDEAHEGQSLACFVFVRTQAPCLAFLLVRQEDASPYVTCRSVERFVPYPRAQKLLFQALAREQPCSVIQSPGCATLKPQSFTGDLIFGCHRECETVITSISFPLPKGS